MSRKRTVVIAIVLLLAAVIALRAFMTIKGRRSTGEMRSRFPVEVLVLSPGDFVQTMSLTGTIMAENQAEVPAKLPGKIIRYLFEEGAWVEKGQTVVTIDRDEVGVEFMETVVEAPISGWLTRRYHDTGTNVGPGMPLAQIADYRRVKLVASLPETELSKVKPGFQSRAAIDAWPGQEFSGQVKSVSPAVDYLSRTVKVEISLSNPGLRLRPGMYGRAEVLVARHKDSKVVPSVAVIEAGGFPKAFVVSGGQALSREVKVSAQSGDQSLIASGLEFGDTLIVSGQYSVVDGSLVEIVEGR
jgi:multidrug efflux pump subunit AcrA (membrane-fusion protein)